MIRKRIKNEIRVRRFKSFHIASTPQIITGKHSIGFFSSIRISEIKKSYEVCFFIWFQLNNPIKNVQAIDFMKRYAVSFFLPDFIDVCQLLTSWYVACVWHLH